MKRSISPLLFLRVPIASLALAGTSFAAADWSEVSSPNGEFQIGFSLSEQGNPLYRVKHAGKDVITPSGLGFLLEGGIAWIRGFRSPEVAKPTIHDGTWKPVWGERSTVRNRYLGTSVRFPRQMAPGDMKLEVRVYDEGVAFRYVVEGLGDAREIHITSEQTEFRFAKDHELWAVYSAQGKYSKVKLSATSRSVERPCVLETDQGMFIAIAEAATVDFPRMRLQRSQVRPHTLVSSLHGPVVAALPLKTPWRVVMAADSAGQLLENNDLLLNLNEPNKIADTSWIRPGKIIREVSLSTEGGLACVDFAVKNGLQFIEFDAGWYGNQQDEKSDARTVSRSNLDLPRVVKYAKENGIGVILYVNRRCLERDLDDLLPLYETWGIAGLKFGFVRHGDQKWTSWMHQAIVKCAKYKLMVDVHDEYRMTGWQRTYPNFMTAEGIGGDETRPPNEQALANLFTRMIAAPADHTFCYFNGYVDQTTSHAAQLAKSVCFFSPWQFLFWYDRPSSAQGEPELEFFKHLPTTWDESKVLHGRIGQYAAIARRSGSAWFIGCLNAGEPRTLELSLQFLPKDGKFEAYIYRDDSSVATRTKVGIERRAVNATTVLKAAMSGRGGVAIRIVPN
jgi:alpha-glucosidase